MITGFSGKEEFEFVGNRPHLRTDEEMLLVNKEVADQAFKKYKKKILDERLLDRGFFRYKTNAYVRRNPIGLLEYIDLQKERYGSKTFCVNFAAMPLYCDCSYIVMSFGSRLGAYISGKDVWWDYCDGCAAEESFENVAEAIEKFVFPWFDEISSEEGYRKKLEEFQKRIPKRGEEWLDALLTADKESLIQQSICQLKLPKRL